jgi:hypothetical protein
VIRALTTVVLACALSGCGPRHTQVTVDNRVEVEIRIAPPPDKLPFDPRGARLLAANRQLSALLGHGLKFDIDAALAAEWKTDFDRQLLEAVEGLLRLFTVLKEKDADEFERTAHALARVECRYSVLVDDARAKFQGDTLLIEQPAHPQKLIDTYAVMRAFGDRDLAWLDARFERVAPQSVAMSDAAAYFHYLSDRRLSYDWSRRHPAARAQSKSERAASDPMGDAIWRIAALYPRLGSSDAALKAEVSQWMFERLPWLTTQYRVGAENLPPVNSNTAMRQGERALCDWLERELPRASAQERKGVLRNLFPADDPIVCPNVDRFAFGLREADAWLKAGKPTEGGKSAEAELMDSIVCPTLRDVDREPVRRVGCNPSWFLFVLGDAVARKRLAAALDARDPELTEQLLASLRYLHSRSENAIALLRLLDPRRPALCAALRALAEVFVREPPKGTDELTTELWRAHPELRGELVYVFARTKSDYFWQKFTTEYAAIQKVELARFLDHGPFALKRLPTMWQALGKGYSRVEPVVERFSLLLPDASEPDASDTLRALTTLVSRLCDERSKAELDTLHRALDARAKSRPAERTALSVLLRDTAPSGCATRKKSSSDEPED